LWLVKQAAIAMGDFWMRLCVAFSSEKSEKLTLVSGASIVLAGAIRISVGQKRGGVWGVEDGKQKISTRRNRDRKWLPQPL
jgi:hypothetical protein